MQKQRFFRSIALCVVMLMLISSIVRAQERRVVSDIVTFDFEDCPVIGELQEVHFGGTRKVEIHRDFTPHVTFVSPEWVKDRDDLEQYPVGYEAGTNAAAKAVFELKCEKILANPNTKVYAKGICSNGFEFTSQQLSRNGISATYLEKAVSAPFPAGMVDFFDPFKIDWYISTDQQDWKKAGTSENRLYVPLSKVPDACAIDDDKVYYSVIHYACAYAAGKTTASDIFSGIWSKFETKSLPRVDRPSKDVNGVPKPMQYWGVDNPLIDNTDCRATKGLLHFEAANCEEWAVFMRYCLGMHSIKDGCDGDIDVIPNNTITPIAKNAFTSAFGTSNILVAYEGHVFLVKNWNIPTLNTLYLNGRKYIDYQGKAPNYYTDHFQPLTPTPGVVIPKGDASGDTAQGIEDPEGLFSGHKVVCYKNGTIYDPSYGTGPFTGIKDWEEKNIDAYAYEIVYYNVKEKDYYSIVYPYENEDPGTQQVMYKCK